LGTGHSSPACAERENYKSSIFDHIRTIDRWVNEPLPVELVEGRNRVPDVVED
jgi:hypothetical protein